VRLSGVASAGRELVTAPVSGQRCVAFRLLVEEPGWRPVLERSACTPFVLVDGGVSVAVEGPFRVLLHDHYDWKFGNDVQLRLAQTIAEAAPRTGRDEDAIYQQNYRYFEALLRPGERVTVEGFASVEVTPAGTRSDLRAPPMRYALTGTPEHPVVVSMPLADH